MRHLGLFEGIGGFSCAARWAGWSTVAWCEWNPFGQKVLRHHFPNAEGHGDITQTDFTIYRGQVDIITGGFPCQPYSTAGKRLGKEDERHLWPEMLRAIREVQPRWVVGENVLGLVNWSGGLVFHEVQADLEAEGYEVFPYVLPACAVNAPHRRDRVWFVAYATSWGREKSEINGELDDCNGKTQKKRSEQTDNVARNGKRRITSESSYRELHTRRWEMFPKTKPEICGGDDGLSSKLDGITFPKWRNESIKAFGNAIVPQVALRIFESINRFETLQGR